MPVAVATRRRRRRTPPAGPPPGRHLHLSGYVLLGPARDAGVAWLTAARRARLTTSLDAASAAPLAARGGRAVLADAGPLDLLLVTPDEAAVLTGTRDPEEVLRVLGAHARHVVLKRGAEGAAWGGRGGLTAAVPAHPPPGPVVDTTGAGDAFAGALLAAWTGGAAPADCLRAATAAAAAAVTRVGARPA